jgi:hypothetical protein
MNWPVQPVGPRPTDTIVPVDRTQGTQRRRGRDEDEQDRKRREPDERPEGEARPDADGHIDVLA